MTEIKVSKNLIIKEGLPEGFVITDRNVFEKYGFLIKGRKFIIENGEKSKDIDTYKKILEKLEDEKRIIAFGGGVVGDLAGFIASTYKRGIEFIQVPTTLLAMIDSSIGGKNGINLGKKKNYVGTIYQPSKILIDPLFLESLSEGEFKNGAAEIIKYGFIFNKRLLERIDKGLSLKDLDFEKILKYCCKLKQEVVLEDEKDRGYRHVLNFGHTLGHAIELTSNLSHGKAISIGMFLEAKIGVLKGIINKNEEDLLKDALISNKLPISFPKKVNINEILNLISLDKKGSFIFSFSKKAYSVKIDKDFLEEFLKNEMKIR